MTRLFAAALLLVLSAFPAFADGWRYSSGATPLVQRGEKLQLLSNGAAMFMCSKHVPLTFGVEVSYDVSEISKPHPPRKVSWIVDDVVGRASMWKQQGIYVLADASTSSQVATAAKRAKSVVGIKTGNLTSLFDVGGLAGGLGRLARACG